MPSLSLPVDTLLPPKSSLASDLTIRLVYIPQRSVSAFAFHPGRSSIPTRERYPPDVGILARLDVHLYLLVHVSESCGADESLLLQRRRLATSGDVVVAGHFPAPPPAPVLVARKLLPTVFSRRILVFDCTLPHLRPSLAFRTLILRCLPPVSTPSTLDPRSSTPTLPAPPDLPALISALHSLHLRFHLISAHTSTFTFIRPPTPPCLTSPPISSPHVLPRLLSLTRTSCYAEHNPPPSPASPGSQHSHRHSTTGVRWWMTTCGRVRGEGGLGRWAGMVPDGADGDDWTSTRGEGRTPTRGLVARLSDLAVLRTGMSFCDSQLRAESR
ncbi:hypothetical protein R3P38DRAFT_3229568 [Favolaschia claudopus]|uniref:Uncharacterized protein n=1 Tax=Favolaschia claudopus TaxID=2862362 RepID=A0AAV9ZNG4_9AGAR